MCSLLPTSKVKRDYRSKMFLIPLSIVCLIVAVHGGYVTRSGKHLVHNGHRVFLSGANTAWVAYGYDFGNHQYQYRRNRYIELMQKVHDAGGNSMRTWVHIGGQTSPHFDGNGMVTGLDNDNSFISDFRQYLDDARARNILIFPTLWNGAVKPGDGRLQGLIQDTNKLQSYITHALIPWVQAVKDHPALGGWDIINEMEGVIRPGISNPEPCYDTRFLSGSGAGWAGETYTAQELQRFINWQVDAIRRTDPNALVTAGSWNVKSNVDHWGFKNLYSDHCLTLAGQKSMGTLTFFSTHSYSWQGQFGSESPFKHNPDDYGFDKPLVVAEFNSAAGGGMSIEQQFQYIYDHGYSGAWSWHANADGDGSDPTDTQMRGIAAIRGRDNQATGGQVSLTL